MQGDQAISIDLTLLRILKHRDRYEKLIRAVPKHVLDSRTQTILDGFGQFFRECPEVSSLDLAEFRDWFVVAHEKALKGEQLNLYTDMILRLDGDVSSEVEQSLMGRLVAADTAYKLMRMVERFETGAEMDLGAELRDAVDQFELDVNRKVKIPWVQVDIDELLREDDHNVGFTWRLPELAITQRPMRPGDFGIIAARPDVGKTSFISDNLTWFATQMKDVFDEDRSILWFNNEGPGRRIISRLYQSALNESISGLVERSKRGTIRQDYVEATGGKNDIIRVFDIHDFMSHEVEDIIRLHPPGIIVFDMVDNIRFGGMANNNGQRTDQLLEAMYQWARVLAVKHDCLVLASSQISGDAEGMQWPPLGMLKDSRTGKQGAADFILTIGTGPLNPNERYLNFTKNKLVREGQPKEPRLTVYFDGSRGRYNSINGDPTCALKSISTTQ